MARNILERPGGFRGEVIDAAFKTRPELRVAVTSSGQLVKADLDGDGVRDFAVLVANSGLAGGAGDFVL